MSVRQSVQALVLSALQASDASSSEAAQALNSLLEAEKSLLPEIAAQLRRSNKITEDVFQLLLSAQQQEEKIGNLVVASSENNNNNNHEDCEKIELENREKLTKYFQDKILDLENQNGELHSQLVVTQSQATSVSLDQHARVLAELQESQRQAQQLLDTCTSETNLPSSNQNQQQHAAATGDENSLASMMVMNQKVAATSANNNSSPQAGWTKEVWFSAFQQLEENSKKMLSAEESENLRVSLNEWKERASNAINRVGRLETDVNSLRFTNGVLQEQVTSLVVFAEKAVLASSSSSAKNNNNNNNNNNNSTSLLSIPNEIQKIIHLASSPNNNNNSNNLRTTNLLTNHAVNAAYRTVELAEDFSSVTVHRNSDSSCNALSANQIPLGAFTFHTVKQLIERFTELSQALYLQELDDVEEKKQMLDRQKRHKSEDDANVAGQDHDQKPKSTTSKVTDTRSVQTDESHVNSSSSLPRHAKNNQRRSEDAASLDRDDDSASGSCDDDDDDLSLQIDADPQIFNALRQITLNLESGFASAAQSESDLNQARLSTSKSEIEALNKQLQASRALLKQWQQRCNEAEGRERVAQNLANSLQSELKQQVALELQVPMIKEMPGILTRFEAVLSTIARNADIDKDENTAKVIASDNMKRHVETMENLFGRLQSQYDAFSQLSAIKYGISNGLNNNNNNNNSNANNNANSNIQQLQNRVNELERELQAQSQDLEIERTRTIEQLERMYQAEEQSRQLRNEMRDLRASALSAEQAQVLRDEIDRLENANNQILNGANRVEDELRREIYSLTSARDALQRQVHDGESRAKTFQSEADRARQDVHKSNASLNAAHDQITKLSRSLHDVTSANNEMAAGVVELQAQVAALRTALLSEAAVREHFARLFPADSAGKEALARVAHLDAELRAQFDLNRELTQSRREVAIELGAVRNQLQESDSERVTSRMRAAAAEAALKKLQDRAEADAAAVGNELAFLRQDCQRLSSERDAALERSELLVKHVDTLSHDQLSASARLYGLTETRSFNLQMQEMNDRNKTLQSKIDDASAVITEREKEISLVQTSLNEECERAASLASRVSEAKELETMLRETIAKSETSLASTVVKLGTTSDALKQVTQSRIDLSNEIVQLQTKVKTLQDQNGELGESKKRLENAVGELRQDVADRDELVAVAREAVASGRGSGSASSLASGLMNKSSTSANNGSSFSSGILGRFTSSIFGGSGGQ